MKSNSSIAFWKREPTRSSAGLATGLDSLASPTPDNPSECTEMTTKSLPLPSFLISLSSCAGAASAPFLSFFSFLSDLEAKVSTKPRFSS